MWFAEVLVSDGTNYKLTEQSSDGTNLSSPSTTPNPTCSTRVTAGSYQQAFAAARNTLFRWIDYRHQQIQTLNKYSHQIWLMPPAQSSCSQSREPISVGLHHCQTSEAVIKFLQWLLHWPPVTFGSLRTDWVECPHIDALLAITNASA